MPHIPAPVVIRRLAAGALVFASLCAALVLRWPPLSGISVPGWLLFVPVTLAGPALFFILGIGAWKLFLATSLGVTVCLTVSWFWWRRYPESELFAVGLLAAAAIWAASGWLAVALGI